MKRLVLISLCIMGSLASFAQTCDYLTFSTVQGEKSMKSDGLVITFSDGKMIAKNAEEKVTFDLSSMSKLFFSDTATAIEQPTVDDGDGVTVYCVSGQFAGVYDSVNAAKNALPKGIYIVKDKCTTRKIFVK